MNSINWTTLILLFPLLVPWISPPEHVQYKATCEPTFFSAWRPPLANRKKRNLDFWLRTNVRVWRGQPQSRGPNQVVSSCALLVLLYFHNVCYTLHRDLSLLPQATQKLPCCLGALNTPYFPDWMKEKRQAFCEKGQGWKRHGESNYRRMFRTLAKVSTAWWAKSSSYVGTWLTVTT